MNRTDLHIVIIEPSAVIREGMLHVLGKTGHFSRITCLQSPESLFSVHQPELVLMNPQLVQNQHKLFQQMQKDQPDLLWVALISSLTDPVLLAMFDAGVSIYEPEHSIISVVANLPLKRETEREEEVLSERETDVLRLLVSGLSNKEIADKLNISAHTVISHRKNISQKTGIKSLSGLTIYAVVQNLISLKP